MGGRSRILRNQGDNFKKICVWTSGYPSWGPMGAQEVQTRGFGGPWGALGPYSRPGLSLPDAYRGHSHNLGNLFPFAAAHL